MSAFEKLISSEISGVHEMMEWRIKNREMLKKSMAIAVRILSVLRKKDISQKKLAEAIDVSPQYVSKILKGQENLTLETITKIEMFLEESLIQIAGLNHKKNYEVPKSFQAPIYMQPQQKINAVQKKHCEYAPAKKGTSYSNAMAA